MSYSSKKAPGRDSVADLTNAKSDLNKDVKVSGKESNQEQFTGTGARSVTPSATSGGAGKRYSEVDREVGTRVQMATNSKGSTTLKDALNTYRSKTYPAVQNPDPVKDRSGVNKAPGRRSQTTAPTSI